MPIGEGATHLTLNTVRISKAAPGIKTRGAFWEIWSIAKEELKENCMYSTYFTALLPPTAQFPVVQQAINTQFANNHMKITDEVEKKLPTLFFNFLLDFNFWKPI